LRSGFLGFSRIVPGLLATACACLAQAGGWMVMGEGGKIVEKDGAIVFSYELQPKRMSLAVLPAPPELARMQRIRFRLKSSADTPVALLLSERKPGGGNYTAIFWAPANAWQQVELTPADFALGDGPSDPRDSNGRLDLDQVEGVGFVDLAQIFLTQSEDPDVPIAVDRPSGPRSLEIANFEVVTAPGAVPRRRAIDTFDRGFVQWFSMGGVKLQLAPKANPVGAAAMQAVTAAQDGKFGLLMRRVANLDLAHAERLMFDMASDNDTTLIVSLEMKNGHRFNQTIYPPGKREVFSVKLKLADFEGEGVFDPAQWKSIAIAEASGQPNTLWIGPMRVE
jgi:hypothetical protein